MSITSARRIGRASARGLLIAALLAVAGCAEGAKEPTLLTARPDAADIATRARIIPVGRDKVQIQVAERFQRDVTTAYGDGSLEPYWRAVSAALVLAAVAEARERGVDRFSIKADDGDVSGRGKGDGHWIRNIRISAERNAQVNYAIEQKGEATMTLAEAEALARRLDNP